MRDVSSSVSKQHHQQHPEEAKAVVAAVAVSENPTPTVERHWKEHPAAKDIQKTIDAVVVAYEKTEGQALKKTKAHTEKLARIIIEYGSALTLLVWDSYCKELAPEGVRYSVRG